MGLEKLGESIQYVKGVGPRRYVHLQRLGIEKVWDMLWHAPRYYFDRTSVCSIRNLAPGQEATIKGRIKRASIEKSLRGMTILKARVEDETGIITAVWFNQAYLKKVLKPGLVIFLTGKINYVKAGLEMRVNEFEILDQTAALSAARIVPVYPATEGLSQKVLRGIAYQVLQEYAGYYPEILPTEVRQRLGLVEIGFALRNLHFPDSFENIRKARERLAFEELLLWQWAVRKIRDRNRANLPAGKAHTGGGEVVNKVRRCLPFKLTGAQERVIKEVFADLAAERPMNRLLQGDVGSGKTVVAALAAAKMTGDGYQTAFMAPTEVLAGQHYRSLVYLMGRSGVKLALLTGKTSLRKKEQILKMVEKHEVDVLVGTHALIQDQVRFAHLGLVVIDEQQRFGVRQRALLVGKGDWYPDTLIMSATPIPRTLAMAICGDMDVSIIDELPPGRKKVRTILVTPDIKERLYRFIRQEVARGRQVYVVCPLVEESEKQDLQAATVLYDTLATQIFPDLHISLLHGRMKPEEKDLAIEAFRRGETDILVTTTVIEVGVDVPNASIMVVEHAERFGLSQLHQLRGRVGRGDSQSYCVLVGEPRTDNAIRRLKIMEKIDDGFEIAREDLRLRGPGDFWGVRQHGLPDLKVADLAKDDRLLEMVQQELDSRPEFNEKTITAVLNLFNPFYSESRLNP